eukprot:scaffold10702_cov33-Attheya_sp.AAC.3
MESMERNISKLVAETAKVTFEDADDERSDSDSDSESKTKSSRNNSALTCQKKGYAVLCKRQEDRRTPHYFATTKNIL